MFASIRRAAASGLILTGLAVAQTTPSQPVTPPPPSTPTPRPSPSPTTTPPTTTTTTQPPAPERTPIYVSGNVVLTDGSVPPDRVTIERICNVNEVRFEGYTDSHGNFAMQLGQSQQLLPDAANSMFVEQTQGFSDPTVQATDLHPDIYWDCELRGRLSGYTSTTLSLHGHFALDDPGVGTIVLFPVGKADSQPVSATSASAPKEARKALDRGIDEAKKGKYDKAEGDLEKAVSLHPRYAEAWTELGKVYRALKRPADARVALNRALESDPNFTPPYQQLYEMAFEEGKWQDLADITKRLLSLNPYNFPDAYYFNGVAYYQLHQWDQAEASLAQAIKADKWNANPKTHYVMGLVLIQKKEYEEASKRLQIFAQLAPKDPQAQKARELITAIQASNHP